MTLSEKIIKDYISYPCLTIKDVKEFIKELKENLSGLNKDVCGDIYEEIDKLAGGELVK